MQKLLVSDVISGQLYGAITCVSVHELTLCYVYQCMNCPILFCCKLYKLACLELGTDEDLKDL